MIGGPGGQPNSSPSFPFNSSSSPDLATNPEGGQSSQERPPSSSGSLTSGSSTPPVLQETTRASFPATPLSQVSDIFVHILKVERIDNHLEKPTRRCLSRCPRLTPTVLRPTNRTWGCTSRCPTMCPRMPGRTTCFASMPRKAVASRSAMWRTLNTSTARTRAARLCSERRRVFGSMGRTTSSRTRSARPSLPRSIPRNPGPSRGVRLHASTEGKRSTSIAKL